MTDKEIGATIKRLAAILRRKNPDGSPCEEVQHELEHLAVELGVSTWTIDPVTIFHGAARSSEAGIGELACSIRQALHVASLTQAFDAPVDRPLW